MIKKTQKTDKREKQRTFSIVTMENLVHVHSKQGVIDDVDGGGDGSGVSDCRGLFE